MKLLTRLRKFFSKPAGGVAAQEALNAHMRPEPGIVSELDFILAAIEYGKETRR